MIRDLFARSIAEEFPHAFTPHQALAAEEIGTFLSDPRNDQAFILRGYAGTGKTSLVSAVVRVWRKLQRPVVLLAPTGRAAKVFSLHAEQPAHTIHRVIYRQKSFEGEDTRFDRGWNGVKSALFVVDEASMVADTGGNTLFGSGRLLDDLIQYVYGGENCRLMMVGDIAQLPPVGEEESPALQRAVLEAYGLNVRTFELTDVVRQASASAVLRNATRLRCRIAALSGQPLPESAEGNFDLDNYVNEHGMPLIEVSDRSEVMRMPGEELIDALEQSYYNWGTSDTIVVTRTNKRANIFNNGIRGRILEREDALERGDRIMIVKNNYFWITKAAEDLPEGTHVPMAFVANGDTARVMRYRNLHEMHGFTFADATLRFEDYDDWEMECRILLDTLQSESPALTRQESQDLYEAVYADYADIGDKRERMKAIRRDPYYNALQIKYAYAVTCHKAQGGQWHEVYVDQGYIPEDADPVAYLRWLYTAFTRTSENLYLVNWPEEQTKDTDDSDRN